MTRKYYSRQTWQRAIKGLEVCLSNIATEYSIQKEAGSDENLLNAINELGLQLTEYQKTMEDMLNIF